MEVAKLLAGRNSDLVGHEFFMTKHPIITL